MQREKEEGRWWCYLGGAKGFLGERTDVLGGHFAIEAGAGGEGVLHLITQLQFAALIVFHVAAHITVNKDNAYKY